MTAALPSWIDFRDTSKSLPPKVGVSFDLPPEEAIAFFQQKGLKPSFAWQDMVGAEHDHAFTVAKMMDMDMLADVQKSLDRALVTGGTFREFKETLIPTLQGKGWWGKKEVLDPLTGSPVVAQLGSTARLQTIFRTNLQSAYATGSWDMIESQAEFAPYLLYDAIDDHRTRPEHAALDGTLLPISDPFWQSHYPPNGWNCRCGVIQLSDDELAARGIKPSKPPQISTHKWQNPRTGKIHNVPNDLDPGWDHNPGMARAEKAKALLMEKLAALPKAIKPNKVPPGWEPKKGMGQGPQEPANVLALRKAAQRQQQAKAAMFKAEQQAAIAKAQTRAAQKQLDDIATGTAPDPGKFHANALKKWQNDPVFVGAPPETKLAMVLSESKKAKLAHNNASQLSNYKKKVLAGKPPTPGQIAALDRAPEAVKAKFVQEIEDILNQQQQAAAAAKANTEATKYLDGLAAKNAPMMEKAALKHIQNTGAAAGMTPAELMVAVKDHAAKIIAQASQTQAINGYKKALLAGKAPTTKQSAAFAKLGKEAQDALIDEVDFAKAQAAAAKAPPPAPAGAAGSKIPAPLEQFKTGYKAKYGKTASKKAQEAFALKTPAQKAKTLQTLGQPGYEAWALDVLKLKQAPAPVASVTPAAQAAAKFDFVKGDVLEYLKGQIKGLASGTAAQSAAIQKLTLVQSKYLYELLDQIDAGTPPPWLKALADADAPPAAPKPPNPAPKPAPAPPAAPAPSPAPQGPMAALRNTDIDVDQLEKIGGQGGSNPGGVYRDRSTGIEWYIKTPDSADIARNEVLAGKLYELAGVANPELKLITFNGKTSVASRMQAGVRKVGPDELAKAAGTRENMAVDAWLANWDVVGLSYDNLQLAGNIAYRIDPGGALRYRAQGGLKGQAFGKTITEFDSLLDANLNRQSAQVFGGTSKAEMVAGAKRVLGISDDALRAAVDQFGPTDLAVRKELLDTLMARKADLARRFPEAVPKPPPAIPKPTKGVSEPQFQKVVEARNNGYTVPADGPALEDQAMHLWTVTSKKGIETRGSVRLRGEALDKLLDEVKTNTGTGPPPAPVATELSSQIVQSVKGIATNPTLRAIDIERVENARATYMGLLRETDKLKRLGYLNAAEAKKYKDQITALYQPWMKALDDAIAPGANSPRTWNPPPGVVPDAPVAVRTHLPKGAPQKTGTQWTKERADWNTADIDNGFATETSRISQYNGHDFVMGERLRATLPDGTEVLFYNDKNIFAMYGRVEVRAKGQTVTSARRIAEVVEELGVDMTPPNPVQQELLYLRSIITHRNQNMSNYRTILAQNLPDDELMDTLAARLSADIGVPDVRALPTYRPGGVRQAFDIGRVERFRPDLTATPQLAKEWRKFEKDYRVHHQVTNGNIVEALDNILNSGGMMAPTTDKLRRGIPPGGMSPAEDMRTGGASYFFTRLKTVRSAHKEQGFVWKSEVVGRTDAKSFDHDRYGKVSDPLGVENDHAGDVAGWMRNARNIRNETNFKEALSIFDRLDGIIATNTVQKNQLIDVLKRHGYNQWPDGRTLDEVIRVTK